MLNLTSSAGLGRVSRRGLVSPSVLMLNLTSSHGLMTRGLWGAFDYFQVMFVMFVGSSGGYGKEDGLESQITGCGAAWLARLTGGQEVAGSNPASPTPPASFFPGE